MATVGIAVVVVVVYVVGALVVEDVVGDIVVDFSSGTFDVYDVDVVDVVVVKWSSSSIWGRVVSFVVSDDFVLKDSNSMSPSVFPVINDVVDRRVVFGEAVVVTLFTNGSFV